MPTENFFVRVPPDSTGKRVRNRADLVVNYIAGTRGAGNGFVEGEIVTTPSGLRGIVYQPTASTVGNVNLILTGSVEAVVTGEAIQTLVGASTIATASGTGIAYYSQAALIAGGNDLGNLANVDETGSLQVRAGDGPFEVDAFGRIRTSEVTTLAEYILRYDDLPDLFETITTGSGVSATHDQDLSAVVLTLGIDSASIVSRRSNRYHLYQAGISQLIEMTVVIGDTGKANVRRRWGYNDDNDGLFFELNGIGSTALRVVQRSSTSGSPVDTAVDQTLWNRDTADGSGDEGNPSGFNLDVSQNNIYWIDFQWLGAGRVRFGVVKETGEKIILHEFRNANNTVVPYMKTGSLPVSWEQENTAGAASISQMTVICTAVIHEGDFSPPEKHFAISSNSLAVSSTGASNIPLLSFQTRASHLGIDNRGWMLPESLELTFSTTASSATVIELVKNPALDGADFAGTPGSAQSMTVIDFAASNASAGLVVWSGIMSSKAAAVQKEVDLTQLFNFDSEVVHRRATIGGSADIYSIRARALSGSGTATAALNWKEILS